MKTDFDLMKFAKQIRCVKETMYEEIGQIYISRIKMHVSCRIKLVSSRVTDISEIETRQVG